MNDTPTASEWETYCDEWYYHMWRLRRKNKRGFNDGFHINNGDEAKGLCDLLNNLEAELTAITKERDRLLEEREQWNLSSAFKEIDMMGVRYAAAEMHHANNMQEVTEQRDRLTEQIEANHKGTYKNSDGVIRDKRQWPFSKAIVEVTLEEIATKLGINLTQLRIKD